MTRRRKILVAIAVTVQILASLGAWVSQTPPADLARAREMNAEVFERLPKTAKWDVSQDMVWGYFFTNQNKVPLAALSLGLRPFGYRTVKIFAMEGGDGGWCLHSERVHINSLESLSVREVRFRRLARLFFNSKFDGWDVGPTE